MVKSHKNPIKTQVLNQTRHGRRRRPPAFHGAGHMDAQQRSVSRRTQTSKQVGKPGEIDGFTWVDMGQYGGNMGYF